MICPSPSATASLHSYHGIVEPVMCEPLVALDACVPQRRILVATEREYRLIHLLSIKYLEAHEQIEVLHRQAGDRQEQIRLQLGDHVLQRVLAKIGQVHEGRYARRELDQLFLQKLALRFVFLLLLGELLLLFLGEFLSLSLILEFLDFFALIDDGLYDVVAQRAPALDTFYSGYRVWVIKDSAERVVIHVYQQRAFPLARQQCRRSTCHRDIQNVASIDLSHVRAVVSQHR